MTLTFRSSRDNQHLEIISRGKTAPNNCQLFFFLISLSSKLAQQITSVFDTSIVPSKRFLFNTIFSLILALSGKACLKQNNNPEAASFYKFLIHVLVPFFLVDQLPSKINYYLLILHNFAYYFNEYQ